VKTRTSLWSLSVALVLAAPVRAEEIVMTSYYPSPRGVYMELRTMNDTFLASQGGDIYMAENGGNVYMALMPSSSVLIGTTTPPATSPKLYVIGPVEADAFRAFEQSGVYAFLEAGPNDGWADMGGFNVAVGAFARTRVDGSILVLQSRSGGNVGIGTVSPTERLDVFGGARIRGLSGTATQNVVVSPIGTFVAEPIPDGTNCTLVPVSAIAQLHICPAGFSVTGLTASTTQLVAIQCCEL